MGDASRITHKLTFDQAQEIRARIRFGESQSGVARAYGVTQAAVWAILKGKVHTRRRRAMTADEYRLHRRQKRREANYGITHDEWLTMLEEAGYACEVCGLKVEDARLHPATGEAFLVCDHDHNTGIARGALCSNCNTALGMAGDSIERLTRMIQYLAKHGRKF